LSPFRTPVAPLEARGKRPGERTRPELSIVMPVYNEGAVIAEVVTTWIQELERLAIDYEFLAYDDGHAEVEFGAWADDSPRLSRGER
jgi:hypothetical protein